MSAIEASSVGVRTMADGTLRLSLDIEPRHSQAAFALFGAPGTPMALAALKSAKAEPAPAKGEELAKWVSIRCRETGFQQWLQDTFPAQWQDAHGDTPAKWAVSTVRAVCGVESRAELDNDEAAAQRFHALIRRQFESA